MESPKSGNKKKKTKSFQSKGIIPQSYKVDPSPKKEYSQEQEKSIIDFLSRLELGDLCFSEIIQNAIALFGETKAGKTTLAHHLVHNPLVPKETNQRPAYVLDHLSNPRRLGEATIGMTFESETVIPNSCQLEQIKVDNKKVVLLDCPGYSDSKGSELVITNAYFHYRVFSKVKNLKFVLVFDSNYLVEQFKKPLRTLQHFFKSFKNIKSIKDQLFKSVVFFFTKTTIKGKKHLKQNLEILKQVALKKLRSSAKEAGELIDIIMKEQRYFTFSQAENGKKAQYDNILKKIHEKTIFWERPLDKKMNEVCMKNLKCSVAQELQNCYSQGFKIKFSCLCDISARRLEKALIMGGTNNKLSLQHILNTFLNISISGKAEDKTFVTQLIQDANKQFYIYGKLLEQQNNEKREYQSKRQRVKEQIQKYPQSLERGYKVQWIQKLEISKMLFELLEEFYQYSFQHGFKRSLQFYDRISYQILKIISQFKMINFDKGKTIQRQKYEALLDNYCYIIYRLIEETKIFKIIFHSQENYKIKDDGQNQYTLFYSDKTVLIYDMINQLGDIIHEENQQNNQDFFERIKVDYISITFEVKENQLEEYYKQIQKYCNNIDPKLHNQKFNHKLMEVSEKKNKSKLFDLDKGSRIRDLISSVKICKKDLMSNNGINNQEKYIEYMSNLGDALSQGVKNNKALQVSMKQKEEMSQKCFKFAIKIYKAIKNVHKTIETYKQLKSIISEKEPLQLKEILIEFAEYAAEHGRRQLAIENLQHAYHLLDKIHEQLFDRSDYNEKRMQREKLSQKIGFTGLEKRYDPSDKYYDSMLTKKFSVLISEKQLAQIEKELSLEVDQ